jgi:hypothetical protein
MTNEFPEAVVAAVVELRRLNSEFDKISYRMGTNGERGLFPRRKSIRAQIVKAEKAFAKKFTEFQLVKREDFYNLYYVKKVDKKVV